MEWGGGVYRVSKDLSPHHPPGETGEARRSVCPWARQPPRSVWPGPQGRAQTWAVSPRVQVPCQVRCPWPSPCLVLPSADGGGGGSVRCGTLGSDRRCLGGPSSPNYFVP